MTVIYPETPGDGSGPRLRPTLDMFLTARYDELEALARAATPYPWQAFTVRPTHADVLADKRADPGWDDDEGDWRIARVLTGHADARHIAQHDPAYVLADIAAKRHILELHYSWNLQAERMADPILQTQVSTAEAVLRVLALPFSEHPDWREEWRP